MEVMSSRASKCSLHRLKNIDENTPAVSEAISRAAAPETPTESMEFLARSWSVSAAELSKALSNSHSNTVPLVNPPSRDHDHDNENGGDDTISINILKESHLPKETSPPISPRGSDEMRELFLLHQALNPDSLSHQQQQLHKNGVYKSMVRKKTMKRWARDQREQKKHEIRTQNAQVHAAVSVAGVAAAVAALAAAAATFPETSVRGNPAPSRTSAAMASAAGVVASHCIEIAEEMGADHDQISAVVNSAVNARTNGDIMALTAAAATALRGASILKTRMQRGYGTTATTAFGASDEKDKVDQSNESNHILSSLNFVSCGRDLLKRTRKGDLHWKQVSFSINSNWQVVAKMKSTYMGGTFTKKKKCVVSGVSCDVAAWAGRAVKDGSGERRTYFGIRTSDRVIEFECRNKDEKLMWTHGIQHMLNCHPNVPLF